MHGCGVAFFLQWTPALAKKVVLSIEKSMPLRLKDQYMLLTQAMPAFEAAFSLFKSFLSEKKRQRVSFLSSN